MHVSYKNRLLRQIKVTHPLAAIIYNCFTYPWRFTRVPSVSILISKNDVKNLETYQRSLLRQLQSLSDRCANIPVYTLLGAKPMEIVLDIKALSFFGNMVRRKESLEHQIICRQLAVKDETSSSFTITIRKTLQKLQPPRCLWAHQQHAKQRKVEVHGEGGNKQMVLSRNDRRNNHAVSIAKAIHVPYRPQQISIKTWPELCQDKSIYEISSQYVKRWQIIVRKTEI